jgi:threonine dehydrogenase-like Zn-dependent dehydrogenase
MRVAVFNGPGKPVSIERVPDPEPDADEVIVRIGRCGICGSDVAMTSGSPFDYPLGCRLGHEFAGEVVALGRDVARARVGDRVACVPSPGCGACASCRDGRPLTCTAQRAALGGFGDYVAVPEHGAMRLPDSLGLDDGALAEPMACGRRALRMADFRPGQTIHVLGAGTMALSVIYWARLQRAGEIVAISRSAHRRDTVLAFGANRFVATDIADPAALDTLAAAPPDIVAECVGKPGMIAEAVRRVRGGGTVISLGMCTDADPLVAALCTWKEARLLFPLGYSLADFEETVRAFDAGAVDPATMVSETITLDALPDTIERLRAGAKSLKILVDPHREPAHA